MSSFRAFLVFSLVLLVALAGLSLSAAAQSLPAVAPAGLNAASTQPDLRPAAMVPVAFLPFVPKMSVPEIPVLSPIAEPHGGAYRIEWTTAARATSYSLQEQDPGGLWTTIYSNGPAIFCDVGGRQAGTYSYRVKATNSSGDSAWSGVISTVISTGIRGRVTNAGAPLGGVYLELRFWNGSGYSTAATTTTDGGGYYSFSPAPVAPGQSYYVRYRNGQGGNPRVTSYLSSAWSRDIVFTSGTYITGVDLDIANIVLSSPAPGATVDLPATFAWQPRGATPSDSYVWEVFQIDGPGYWDSPFLGYVGSFTLTGLPAGFGGGTQYGWAIWEQNAQGDGGGSYYYYTVTFSSGALAPAPDPGGAGLPNAAVIERVEAAKAAQH